MLFLYDGVIARTSFLVLRQEKIFIFARIMIEIEAFLKPTLLPNTSNEPTTALVATTSG